VIRLIQDFAGFSAGQAEKLRRALGAKDASEALEKVRAEFFRGAIDQDVDRETTHKVWASITGFGGYAFSKAHAAAFAVITYWSAYLRVYHPVPYFCALLCHAPLGSYSPHSLEAEARRIGLKFLPFDVNKSDVQPTIESGKIRHGLKDVRGLGVEHAAAIIQARDQKSFRSVTDFIQRTGLTDRRVLDSLILSGAFDSLGERRQLLWELVEALKIASRPQQALPLFDSPDERVNLPPMSLVQRVGATFAATGYTVDMHLAKLRSDDFARAGCFSLQQLQKIRVGAKVRVGGLVMDGLRRPPTAQGISFIRLENDEYVFDSIIPIEVYARYWESLRHSVLLMVEGTLQRSWPHITVVAQKVMRLE